MTHTITSGAGFPIAVIETRGSYLHPHEGEWKPSMILTEDESEGLDDGYLVRFCDDLTKRAMGDVDHRYRLGYVTFGEEAAV